MKRTETFDEYLDKIGAERTEKKGLWEHERFLADGIICIVYFNNKGDYGFSNEIAKRVFRSYEMGLYVNIQTEKRDYNLSRKLKKKLLKRDGNKCFYSFVKFPLNGGTIEHLIPISKGGKNNMDNLVLCTKKENKKVGAMSLIEKINYRERNFAERFKKINKKKEK